MTLHSHPVRSCVVGPLNRFVQNLNERMGFVQAGVADVSLVGGRRGE